MKKVDHAIYNNVPAQYYIAPRSGQESLGHLMYSKTLAAYNIKWVARIALWLPDQPTNKSVKTDEKKYKIVFSFSLILSSSDKVEWYVMTSHCHAMVGCYKESLNVISIP